MVWCAWFHCGEIVNYIQVMEWIQDRDAVGIHADFAALELKFNVKYIFLSQCGEYCGIRME